MLPVYPAVESATVVLPPLARAGIEKEQLPLVVVVAVQPIGTALTKERFTPHQLFAQL